MPQQIDLCTKTTPRLDQPTKDLSSNRLKEEDEEGVPAQKEGCWRKWQHGVGLGWTVRLFLPAAFFVSIFGHFQH